MTLLFHLVFLAFLSGTAATSSKEDKAKDNRLDRLATTAAHTDDDAGAVPVFKDHKEARPEQEGHNRKVQDRYRHQHARAKKPRTRRHTSTTSTSDKKKDGLREMVPSMTSAGSNNHSDPSSPPGMSSGNGTQNTSERRSSGDTSSQNSNTSPEVTGPPTKSAFTTALTTGSKETARNPLHVSSHTTNPAAAAHEGARDNNEAGGPTESGGRDAVRGGGAAHDDTAHTPGGQAERGSGNTGLDGTVAHAGRANNWDEAARGGSFNDSTALRNVSVNDTGKNTSTRW